MSDETAIVFSPFLYKTKQKIRKLGVRLPYNHSYSESVHSYNSDDLCSIQYYDFYGVAGADVVLTL